MRLMGIYKCMEQWVLIGIEELGVVMLKNRDVGVRGGVSREEAVFWVLVRNPACWHVSSHALGRTLISVGLEM